MSEIKRKRGRPPKGDSLRVEKRPRRTPVSGDRNILTVANKDPNFFYRWVLDTDVAGANVFRFINAGYDFVTSEEQLGIGDYFVYKSENVGSVYRVPANNRGHYYYLMKQPIEFYQEDDARKQQKIDRKEENLKHPNPAFNQYGKNQIYR